MGTESLLSERFRRADDARVQEWLKQLAPEQYEPPAKSGPPSPTPEPKPQPTIANDKAGTPTAVYDPTKGWVLTSDPSIRVKPNGVIDVLSMAAAAAGERFIEGHRRMATGRNSKSEPVLVDYVGASAGKKLGGAADVLGGFLQATFFPSAAAGYLAGEGMAALTRWSGEMSDEALQGRLKHARLHAPGEVPFLEALLTRPYEERIDAARAGAALPAEVGTGFVPGYTIAARLAVRGVAALVGRRTV